MGDVIGHAPKRRRNTCSLREREDVSINVRSLNLRWLLQVRASAGIPLPRKLQELKSWVCRDKRNSTIELIGKHNLPQIWTISLLRIQIASPNRSEIIFAIDVGPEVSPLQSWWSPCWTDHRILCSLCCIAISSHSWILGIWDFPQRVEKRDDH